MNDLRRLLDLDATSGGLTSTIANETLERIRRVHDALATLSPDLRALLGVIAMSSDQGRRESATRVATSALEVITRLREAMRLAAGLMMAPAAFPATSSATFLTNLRREVDRRVEALPRFREWAQYGQACADAAAAGLRLLVEAHRRGDLKAAEMEAAVERAILQPWVNHVRDAEPLLRDFDGDSHSRKISEFRDADDAHLKHSRDRVLSAISTLRPVGLSGAAEGSEPGTLLRQFKRKRGHLPIRKLFQQIPNLLPRLKPCFLMSPLSVAQYLPPKGRPFDIVVFDEASQIGTHDAIGVIARGGQVVIVGDSKQLPPTAFFERSFDADEAVDEADIADLESVLDEAIAARMPEQSLGWHYRSRHESLIRFSNHNYYNDLLHVFPAARGRVPDLGVKWHHVQDGVYEFGSTRQNPREAQALVDWLVKTLLETPAGSRTFGVVTFSQAQQTLVEDLLDSARRDHPAIEPHFSDELQEHVFVKNLENVQGDERDEILFSVCYGPAEDRRVRMNFGPLNRSGGERRLNVAVTRARCLLRVFSSITHDQIDLTRTQATGARHLREFLRFARDEDTSSPRSAIVSEEHDSDFERAVCDALRLLGHDVDPQVGCGGYRIDLGVRHPEKPGVYVLGVECDGAAYHSGATARDRDRLRQSVLEGLGWRLHRVWSTDWEFNREQEVEKLRLAIEKAVRDSDLRPIATPVPAAGVERVQSAAVPKASPASFDRVCEPEVTRAPGSVGPPIEVYARATLGMVSQDNEDLFDQRFRSQVRELILKVVRIEGPVHQGVVARAVASAFNWKKTSERVRVLVINEAQRLCRDGSVGSVDEFLWPSGLDPATWSRIRGADVDGDLRSISQIAMEEIMVALGWHLERSFSMPQERLVQETARTFGFKRVGEDIEDRIGAALDRMIAQNRARRLGDGRVEWIP